MAVSPPHARRSGSSLPAAPPRAVPGAFVPSRFPAAVPMPAASAISTARAPSSIPDFAQVLPGSCHNPQARYRSSSPSSALSIAFNQLRKTDFKMEDKYIDTMKDLLFCKRFVQTYEDEAGDIKYRKHPVHLAIYIPACPVPQV